MKNKGLEDAKKMRFLVEQETGIAIGTKSKTRKSCKARFMYLKICRDNIENITYQTIGKPIGRTREGVYLGLKYFHEHLTYDKKLKKEYLNLEELCVNKIKELANPFEKYLKGEDYLQRDVMAYIQNKYPNVLAFHVPNEGKRTPFERFKFKFLGGVSGVPDVLIFQATKEYNGLALELKYGKNRPTKNQMEMLDQFKKHKWRALWSNNFDFIKLIIDTHLKDA